MLLLKSKFFNSNNGHSNLCFLIIPLYIATFSFVKINFFILKLKIDLERPSNNEFKNNHHAFNEFEDDFDDLSALVRNVDSQAMAESMQQAENKISRLDQYMLYAEIYMLMQYSRMKRAVHNMTAWFSN